MNKNKRAKLERKGWKVGSPDEFLGLSPEESAYIELKIALGEFIQQKRKEKHLTQIQVAKLIHSGQSRVANMEKAEKSVSVDLMIRSLFAMGTTLHRYLK
jgi:predicted XRE-type DNA-binding protein